MNKAILIAKKVKSGELKAADIIKEYLERIKEKDEKINAFLEVFTDSALKKAAEIDLKIKQGKPVGKLAGVPVAIKDNMLYKNHKMSCASKILEHYVSPYSATVVEKLLNEDAVIIGRTNMDEFAMGSSTENSSFKNTKNPLNENYVPGGSSGGSAAAVAADMALISLGSDTGGSIRQPAAFCGVYGLKPTYGSVSRYGLAAFASSLDQIGCFTNNPEDMELVFSVISGHDKRDSTSSRLRQTKKEFDIKTVKIGIPKEHFMDGLKPEIKKEFLSTVQTLKNLGANIINISLPNARYALPAYYIISSSEASANLGRYDGMRYGLNSKNADSLASSYKLTRGEGFGPEVKRRIMLGTYSLSAGYYDAYYIKAQKIRTLIKKDFKKAFKEVDIILTPTTPTNAFKFGEKSKDPISMYLSDIFTIPANLAGVCAVSAPSKNTDENGLSAGMQFISNHFNENALFPLMGLLNND
ncbi:MAG: Asp-tRNA(Asn)/Glu-tRNA(Gln) amidotransferase subunit GatA [Elusimicrobiales bacterium]|nr:Asp-tRNA(Asn)/Glu-tRNA(Gln) amidotransferase subunit GatA [Elusimicrobiales bacterium]